MFLQRQQAAATGVGMVNVADYGALGADTDDTGAFQRAHDALSARGGTIYMPGSSGRYLIRNLIVQKPIRYVGDGAATVLRTLDPTAQEMFRTYSARTSFADFAIEGTKNTVGGTIRGINIYAPKCAVRRVLFSGLNIGIDLEPVAHAAIIDECEFERLVSSSGGGCAILLEGVSDCRVSRNRVDSSGFQNLDGTPSAAIFFSQILGGSGPIDNEVVGNTIKDHPQVGIACGSTTYADWNTVLGQGRDNLISDNVIMRCGSTRGDAAGSAIAITANIQRTRILRNRITAARGRGVSVEGALYTTGTPGTPKLNEIPDHTTIADNDIAFCAEQGIYFVNTTNTLKRDNASYSNGLTDS